MALKSLLDLITRGGGIDDSDVPYARNDTFGVGPKIVGGLGTFVSGAATIATGLTKVVAFQVEILATGSATGATEVTNAFVTGTPATGSVVVQGYRLATTTASASGTGQFYWLAIGF